MRNTIITTLLALSSILIAIPVIGQATTSNATVGFYVADEDKGVSLINEDGQIKVKNYEGFTIHVKQNTNSQYITSDDGLTVNYKLDPTLPAQFTIVNGPSN